MVKTNSVKKESKEKIKTTGKSIKKKTTKVTSKVVKKKIVMDAKSDEISFPIIGIGASAGGLEALEGFFTCLPPKINVAIVVIQHLAPKYKSIMGSLLKKYTKLKICQIKDNTKVEPNCVYLNTPDMDVGIINRTLLFIKPLETHAARLPIDFFFRSLSDDQGKKAICIVLSGTGADGTLGLKAIKGSGGLTIAQDETQSKYDSMPRSAINTGLVDYILPVEKMPDVLAKYVKNSYIEKPELNITTEQKYQSSVIKILLQVRTKTGQDFSNYKQNTIRRRIERRMAVHQIDKISDYLQLVRENSIEVETLYQDLLIGVTSFFRDPEAFDIVKNDVIPDILNKKRANSTFRAWIPGCATGEEAYSIAMVLRECMEKNQKHCNVQIFATDIDENAIEFARAAIFPESIAADVTPTRLKKFFIKDKDTYKVNKQVREMIVFANQSLIKDPPFSKLDLVCCRNVLIYMDNVLQKRILPIFHYTLNHDGYLFLGSSESIGEFTDFFSAENTKWKIYKRKGSILEKPKGFAGISLSNTSIETEGIEEKRQVKDVNIFQLAEKEIFKKYAPPFVLVNNKHEIIYINGKINRYLLTPTGVPEFNILKMAHDDIRYKLRTLLHKVVKKKETVITHGLKLRDNNQFFTVDITIKPFISEGIEDGLAMVIFEEKEPVQKMTKNLKFSKIGKENSLIISLSQELKSTKDYLQATVEELETSNEELKSTNEELQSTNEELETSKEEQQSTSEELETVNSELQNKVNELSRSNNDLSNLLASTDIATLFLDLKLNIIRFTPLLAELFNVLPSDLNRPISDITSKFNNKTLKKDAEQVLRTLIPIENKIETVGKEWYNMRILPYRTVENMIDGLVITFASITNVMQMKNVERIANTVSHSDDAITVQDLKGNILDWNRGAEKMYGYSEKEALKMKITDLMPKSETKGYKTRIKDIKDGKDIEWYETIRKTKDGRTLNVSITLTRLLDKNGTATSISTTERDITTCKRNEEASKKIIDDLKIEITKLRKRNTKKKH